MKLIEMIEIEVSEADCSDDRGCGSSVLHPDAVAAAITARLHECVKPLEWLGGGSRHHAENYVIEDVSVGQREIRRLLCANFGTTYLGDYAGDRPLEAAKAAAQAHYAAQIVEGLNL